MIIPDKFLQLPGDRILQATANEIQEFNKWIKDFYDVPFVDHNTQFRAQLQGYTTNKQVRNLVVQTCQQHPHLLDMLLELIEKEFPQHTQIAKQMMVVA